MAIRMFAVTLSTDTGSPVDTPTPELSPARIVVSMIKLSPLGITRLGRMRNASTGDTTLGSPLNSSSWTACGLARTNRR